MHQALVAILPYLTIITINIPLMPKCQEQLCHFFRRYQVGAEVEAQWLAEFALNQEVLGLTPATSNLFAMKVAVLSFFHSQNTQKINGGRIMAPREKSYTLE